VTITQTITYKPIIIGSGGIIDPEVLKTKTMVLVSTGFIVAWYGWGMIV
jgi:hypothetical protein